MNTKHCGRCGVTKPVTSFNKNKSKKDGLKTMCRECSKKSFRKYYHDNHEKHRRAANERRTREVNLNRKLMLEYLSDKQCVDCGFKSHPAALDFDHVRGDKRANVSTLVATSYSWSTILEEIEKCEIRCANCHRIKTAKQLNWYTAQT